MSCPDPRPIGVSASAAVRPETSAPAIAPVSLVAPVSAADALKRILLVDDEAHVLRVMRLSLDRNGYEVDTALDGEVALRMLREQRYAALVIGAEFAPGGRGLCESIARLLGADAPLMLVLDEEDDVERPWPEPAPGVERVERPLSLRWIVARLNEYFGDYERR